MNIIDFSCGDVDFPSSQFLSLFYQRPLYSQNNKNPMEKHKQTSHLWPTSFRLWTWKCPVNENRVHHSCDSRWNDRNKRNDYITVKNRLARRLLLLAFLQTRNVDHDSWRIEIEKIFGVRMPPIIVLYWLLSCIMCTVWIWTRFGRRSALSFSLRFNNLQNGQFKIIWFMNRFTGPNSRQRNTLKTIALASLLLLLLCCWDHLKHTCTNNYSFFFVSVLHLCRRPSAAYVQFISMPQMAILFFRHSHSYVQY